MKIVKVQKRLAMPPKIQASRLASVKYSPRLPELLVKAFAATLNQDCKHQDKSDRCNNSN